MVVSGSYTPDPEGYLGEDLLHDRLTRPACGSGTAADGELIGIQCTGFDLGTDLLIVHSVAVADHHLDSSPSPMLWSVVSAVGTPAEARAIAAPTEQGRSDGRRWSTPVTLAEHLPPSMTM